MPNFTILFSILLKVLFSAEKQEEERKGIYIGKEEIKSSLLTDSMIIYIENPEGSTK